MKIVKIEYLLADVEAEYFPDHNRAVLSMLIERLIQDPAFESLSMKDIRKILLEKIISYDK
jgi:hypothetical protein